MAPKLFDDFQPQPKPNLWRNDWSKLQEINSNSAAMVWSV